MISGGFRGKTLMITSAHLIETRLFFLVIINIIYIM